MSRNLRKMSDWLPLRPPHIALVGIIVIVVVVGFLEQRPTLPRGCRHVEAAWRFVDFSQREGLAIICRLQGKHMPVKEPPPNFGAGHPNLEVGIFERLAASPYTFIQPRIRIWNEYQHELEKAFEHVWNWPVPESELTGLTGDARQQKVDDLCRAEIKSE